MSGHGNQDADYLNGRSSDRLAAKAASMTNEAAPLPAAPAQPSEWMKEAERLATDYGMESLRVGSYEARKAWGSGDNWKLSMLRDKRQEARAALLAHLSTLVQLQGADTARCPACNGYGRVNDGSGARSPYGPKCPTCGGSGAVLAAQAEQQGSDHPVIGVAGEAVRVDESDDRAILDWLETKIVQVSDPLRHGSRHLFYATLDIEDERSDLRAKVRASLPSPPRSAAEAQKPHETESVSHPAQDALLEAVDALISNEEHATSGGMRSYQVGSQTWELWEALRDAAIRA